MESDWGGNGLELRLGLGTALVKISEAKNERRSCRLRKTGTLKSLADKTNESSPSPIQRAPKGDSSYI